MTKTKKTMSIFLSIMMILVTMLGNIPARAESVIPEITFVGVGHSPLVEGDSEAFYLVSKNYTGDVQYRIFLYCEAKGTWEDISKGYTEAVNPRVPYKIVPDKTFTLGKYKLLVWVKRAAMTGVKSNENGDYDSTYTAYLNCVNRDDSNRVYANGNMQVERNVFAVGENITVNGIEGISGMKAPYSYKLHYYNVGKDSWAKEVTSYDSSIVWKAEETGVYMLDVWAKSSDSKAKYEAWNLKEINVEDAEVYRENGKTYAGDSDKTVIITGKNVSYKNAKVNGNVYVYGNNVTLENLTVNGNIIIDTGKDGITSLNSVTAKKVDVRSGSQTSQPVLPTGGQSYKGTVSVNIDKMPEFFTVGQPLSFTVNTTPDLADVSATSSNTAVAAVTTNGHTIYITPVSAGKTAIAVSGSYSEYYTGKAIFYIDVKPAAPAVTADDAANTIIGINNAMEFKVDAGGYVKYNGMNMPNLAGNHTVLVRVAAVAGVSYESEPVTLNFTYANPAPSAPSVTADDTANMITGLDNTMEFKVDASEYVKYNGTNAPNLAGEHTVSVRVAENLAEDTPAGSGTVLTFTMDTPTAPSVTADDAANVITGINNTMEFKVDAAEYIKYNGTNIPNLAGMHTVLVRVAAAAGMNYAGAPTTLNFTYANPAPAAPSVTADDTANVITGLDNTMEFKVDAAEYIKYNGTNAPNLAGEHTVLVRLSENLAADTPAGSETTLTFTMNTPAAPSVTADDTANVIIGINNTMEFMIDAAEYIKYNGTNMPGLAGIHTVLIRIAAVLGISYASLPVTLNFTYANPAPAAPSVTADDAANVITGLDNTMEFSIDASGYVKYDGTNAPDLSGEHTVLVRVAENPATDTPAGLTTSLSFTIPVSILNVNAANGTVTITLKDKPTTAPLADDFTATINIDGAGANALALSGFNYDGNVTVTYTFTPVAKTTSVKNAEVAVTLVGKETVSAAFIVPVLTEQEIALNTVNAAIGDYNCNISVETLNTATGRTNAISANLDYYNSRIPSSGADFTADSLWQMIDEVNLVRAQAALRALGSAGLTCVDPTANPSVTFVRPAPSTDGSGITYSVGYKLGYTNVTPSYINGNPVITRSDTNAGSISLIISIMGVRGIGINVYYDVTVPTGTDPVTWVLR